MRRPQFPHRTRSMRFDLREMGRTVYSRVHEGVGRGTGVGATGLCPRTSPFPRCRSRRGKTYYIQTQSQTRDMDPEAEHRTETWYTTHVAHTHTRASHDTRQEYSSARLTQEYSYRPHAINTVVLQLVQLE